MGWITVVAVLVAWLLIGLGVAYLFGSFVHRVDELRDIGELASPVLSYLRRAKRAKTLPRAAGQVEARRVAGGRPRGH